MSFYSQFADYYQTIFPFKQPVYNFLLSYDKSHVKDIIDIGCSTGHYTDKLTKDNYAATGIDFDESMIAWAKKNYPSPSFHTMNMLDIESLNLKYDLAFCIGNTAAHLTADEFDLFIRSVYNVLRPGGIWIFQVRNWDYVVTLNDYEFPVLKAESQIQFIRSYSNIKGDSLQFNTRLMDNEKKVFEQSVPMYPISTERYVDIHKKHGFTLIDHFGDFKKSPHSPNSDSASIFVLQK
jgi:SAM-dependent methyltransferase